MEILKKYWFTWLENYLAENFGEKHRKEYEKYPLVKDFFTNLKTDEVKKIPENLPQFYGMQKFCERLQLALEKGEKICIYGDYDADGVCATTTLFLGLQTVGFEQKNLNYYIPNRFDESYGLNLPALLKIAQNHDLIITVDCGISATDIIQDFKKTMKNKGKNVQIIITDHHQLQDKLETETILINPQIHDKNKNFKKNIEQYKKNLGQKTLKNLASTNIVGTSVAWFCLVSLANYMQKDPKIFNKLLPLVAIGTIADVQSVIDPTNRVLIKAGLDFINQNNHGIEGLENIIKNTNLWSKLQNRGINTQDIGFILAPLLNAPGRMEDAKLAVKILLENQNEDVQKMVKLNEERKKIVKNAAEEIKNKKITNENVIIEKGDWSKGIIGLIAANLNNFYNLPTVILTEKDGELTASVRAPKGFDVAKILNETGDLFEKFGGHAQAAGFTLKMENLEKFKQVFEEKIKLQKENVEPEKSMEKSLPKEVAKDLENGENVFILESDLNWEFAKNIWYLEPYGQGLPLPNFIVNLQNLEGVNIKIFGQNNQYFKLKLNGVTLNCFSPLPKKWEKTAEKGAKNLMKNNLWVKLRPSINYFNNKAYYEFLIEKIYNTNV